jgi:SNF2 family DNA or RNA helicase
MINSHAEDPDEVPTTNFVKTNDKMKNLDIILKHKLHSPAKVLIFSAYDNTFDAVCNVLEKNKMTYKYLKGNESQIRTTMHSYKNTSDLSCLFINARNFGSGLNLENTTDIIMFHKLDSEIEKQVVGRAQRYGRNQSLNIWYLLHENEYDNVIKK